MTGVGRIEQQLAEYLKENPGSERFMRVLWEKYRSLGRFSGIINLTLTHSEAQFLNGLMRKHYKAGDEVRLSAAQFLKSFEQTRFKDTDFLLACEFFFGEGLGTKKEERLDFIKRRQEFFESLQEYFRCSRTGEWLKALAEGGATAAQEYIYSLYRKSGQGVEKYVKQLAEIEELLSDGLHTSLPILAAEATKDPHALDTGQELYRILIYFLSYLYESEVPRNQEGIQNLLHQAGIRQDVGTRTIMTYGLKGIGRKGSKGWEHFWSNREPLVLTLRNLEDVEQIQTVPKQSPVFAFENPAVFMRMIEQEPDKAYLCTSGQLHTLDHYFIKILLRDSRQKLYYSGDYDPEGLLIADKLWSLYPDQIGLMGYETELYNRSLSEQTISAKRLRQLVNLKNPALLQLAEEMKVKQRAGYQEYVIDSLTEQIQKCIG